MDLTQRPPHKPCADVDLVPHLRDCWKYLEAERTSIEASWPAGKFRDARLAEIRECQKAVWDAGMFIKRVLQPKTEPKGAPHAQGCKAQGSS